MADLRHILEDLDISAVVDLNDKINECNYFYNVLSNECNRDKFRWLLGAFLNSCYGYLEDKAAYFHYANCDPDSGEPIEDWQSLETLQKYVKVFKTRGKSGFVKTSGLSELTKMLYQFRNSSTHDGGVGIMETGANLPHDFQIGVNKSKGVPALNFCKDILLFFTALEKELD